MKPKTDRYLNALFKAFLYPGVMVVLGLLPGVNYLVYSGHGGLGWIFILLCFPWVIYWLVKDYLSQEEAARPRRLRMNLVSLAGYLVLIYPLSYLVSVSLRKSFGLAIGPNTFWGYMTFPLSLLGYLFSDQ